MCEHTSACWCMLVDVDVFTGEAEHRVGCVPYRFVLGSDSTMSLLNRIHVTMTLGVFSTRVDSWVLTKALEIGMVPMEYPSQTI